MEFDGVTGTAVVMRPEVEQETQDRMTASVSSSVTDMLIRIEGELDRADSQIGEKMHVLDQDNDGVLRCTACRTGTALHACPAVTCMPSGL